MQDHRLLNYSTPLFIINSVFLSISKDIFCRRALTLEKYARPVHIFNLQIRSNAISIASPNFPEFDTRDCFILLNI